MLKLRQKANQANVDKIPAPRLAQVFGLKLWKSKDGDFGEFGIQEKGVKQKYSGVVQTLFEKGMGQDVSFKLIGMRVIEHLTPLFLVGAAMVYGGCKPPS